MKALVVCPFFPFEGQRAANLYALGAIELISSFSDLEVISFIPPSKAITFIPDSLKSVIRQTLISRNRLSLLACIKAVVCRKTVFETLARTGNFVEFMRKKETPDIVLTNRYFTARLVLSIRPDWKERLVIQHDNDEEIYCYEMMFDKFNPLHERIHAFIDWLASKDWKKSIAQDPRLRHFYLSKIEFDRHISSGFPVKNVTHAIPFPKMLTRQNSKPNSDSRPIRVVYFGSLLNPRNLTSLVSFIEKIWFSLPEINRRKYPLNIFGIGDNKVLTKLAYIDQTVVLRGQVSNPAMEFSSRDVAVVPVYSRSGIQTKVLELLSYGCTVYTDNHVIGALAVDSPKLRPIESFARVFSSIDPWSNCELAPDGEIYEFERFTDRIKNLLLWRE